MSRLPLVRPSVARAVVGALLAAAVALPALVLPAEAAAPTAAGWWSFASRDGLPQPPSPPDVHDGDLLVQGGDPSGAPVGAAAPTQPSAVAAVRFVVPPGSTVGALRLQVADGALAQDVRAYPTLATWQPSQGGPLQEAPQPDRSRSVQGVLEGSVLVFPGIARLLTAGGTLSVVLLPGAVDRVVLEPTASALAVTAPPAAARTPSAGTAPDGAPASGAPGAAGAQTQTPGTGTAPVPLLTDGLPATVATGADPAPVEPPALAGASGVPALLAPSAHTAGALPALLTVDDTRTRYLAATEAVLVLALFGLLGWGPLARLGALVAGPVLPGGAPAPDERGVGRFVRPRTGRPARL